MRRRFEMQSRGIDAAQPRQDMGSASVLSPSTTPHAGALIVKPTGKSHETAWAVPVASAAIFAPTGHHGLFMVAGRPDRRDENRHPSDEYGTNVAP